MNTASLGGYDFAYQEAGHGQPVLLVHGSASDLRSWDEVQRTLSHDFRVVSYSRRYHFPNHIPAEISGYSPALHARDLITLMEELKLGSVHLVGHSYGALVALPVAQQRPDLVRTLTLAEPAVFSLIAHTPEMSSRQEQQAAIVAELRAKIAAGSSSEAAGQFIAWVRGPQGVFGIDSSDARQIAIDNAPTLLPALGGLAAPFGCEDAQALTMPVLLIRGEQTRPWYSAVVHEFARCLPSAETVEIPRASHFNFEDNPEDCCRKLAAFLQRH
jgi:non-heme chloroperoxidase